ncbi:amino acid adenylation domain-containing protein [Paenibacillus sp. M1]|uniref:Amino acid adenylation domain-containing protein n=1 Tax=Paenibacillus haidiansis TaxID=1574488 RepID=A0ABU7VPV7_9BACL
MSKLDNLTKSRIYNDKKFEPDKLYWIEKLKGTTFANFETDFISDNNKSFINNLVSINVPDDLSNNLLSIGNHSEYGVFVILVSGITYLLGIHSGNTEVLIGIPALSLGETQVFNDILYLKAYINKNITFQEYVHYIQEEIIDSYEHQNFPVEMVWQELNAHKTDIPAISTAVQLSNLHGIVNDENNDLDLVFNFDLNQTSIKMNINYNANLYCHENIYSIAKQVINFFKVALDNLTLPLSEIDIVPELEKVRIINFTNSNNPHNPPSIPINQTFEKQAEKYRDHVAVTCDDASLTYGQLNNRANQLARLLRENGISKGNIVGIILDRSINMIISILAVLKSGAAYLPLDPDYPESRVRDIINDAGADFILSESYIIEKYSKKIMDYSKMLLINESSELLDSLNSENLANMVTGNDLAYVIYTSGSTGKPKGTLIRHYSVYRVVNDTNYINITPEDTLMQLSNYAFDGSIFDIFGALLNGAKLEIVKKETVLNLNHLSEFIFNKQISVFFVTTALFNTIVDYDVTCLQNVRKILFGGERVSVKHVQKALNYLGTGRLMHMYGPTESTVYATFYPVNNISNQMKTLPIGKPVMGTQVYILDEHMNTLPIGAVGELYISGYCLAQGYLGNPSLTEQKFIDHPFIHGEKIYKTGDIARWLTDGNIEYIGRKDDQVKIRGFRIELGEIENRMLEHEEIKEAVVFVEQNDNNDKYLCAYYVSNKALQAGEIRKFLLKNLMEYMIPLYFIRVNNMPLTANGKIDKKKLQNLSKHISREREYAAPRNEIEEQLAEIWKAVLKTDKSIGINDSLFELGGHSLTASILCAKIQKLFHVEIPLSEVFSKPYICDMADYIRTTGKGSYQDIIKTEERDFYPLSSAQRRMHVLTHLQESSTYYNIPSAIFLEGKVDKKRIEQVFTKLIERHEAFRTSFHILDGIPMQKIERRVNFSLEYSEICETEIHKVTGAFSKPFDLTKAPLLRAGLFKIHEEKHLLVIDLHHIISDGTSLGILIEEFSKIYNHEKLEEQELQYKDFAVWQLSKLKDDYLENQENYWLGKFQGEIPVLNLPTDMTRPSLQSTDGKDVSFSIPKELTDKLIDISKETNSTLFMVLLTAFYTLLYRYTNQEDIIVGTPIANRSQSQLQNIIGMFVNTLAMRNNPTGKKSFMELLLEVKQNALEAYQNQDYQFEELVDKLNVKRDMSRNPVFDVMFSMQNMHIGEIKLENLKIYPYENDSRTSKFDIILNVLESNGGLDVNLQYCTKLFLEETIINMGNHFHNILSEIADNQQIKLKDIKMLSELEEEQLLYGFNNFKLIYPKDKTIHGLFEEQVERTPDNVALIYKDLKLSFQELNERANKLAWLLREQGAGPDTIIGIMAERSFDMIIGILGILKAGGAYLPIDPAYPAQRVQHMLDDSGCPILLAQDMLAAGIHYNGILIQLDQNNIYNENYPIVNPNNVNRATDLSHVIYTSGSTGSPKGVMIQHRSAVNNLYAMQMHYPVNEQDAYLFKTAFTFDVSVMELFSFIFTGSKLVLLEPGGEKDPKAIMDSMDRYNITHINFVPSMFRLLLNKLDQRIIAVLNKLKYIFLAGEAVTKDIIHSLGPLTSEVNISNIYGPTETIYTTRFDILTNRSPIEEYNSIPIGKPFDNYICTVLDKDFNLCPKSMVGELYVSGDGVARGYLNRAELTESRFIKHPYMAGERMYKTGDLVKWLPDGNLEYIGRIDHQVKIRGYRVEFGEIEHKLLELDEIKEAVVLAREDENQVKYLCAYYVAAEKIHVNHIRQSLSANLPDYMIPSYFIYLDQMPLNANGKADRQKLLTLDNYEYAGVIYEEAGNALEKDCVEIWKKILKLDKIGMNDNFFDIGGHSLRAYALVHEINKALKIDIPLKAVFIHPTVRKLTQYIQNYSGSKSYKSIEAAGERKYYPVSAAQKRLFTLQQFDAESKRYNMPIALKMEGNIYIDKIEQAIIQLVKRHEALRTTFNWMNDEIVQIINEDVSFALDLLEIDDENNIEDRLSGFMKSFDLSKAPLFNALLIRLNERNHILLFDVHHIISDGISLSILSNDFINLYNGNPLPDLRLQYKDFSEWQRINRAGNEFKNQESYWLKRLEGEIPVLNFPTDFPRPNELMYEGDRIDFTIPKEIAKEIKNINKQTQTTLYMFMLACFNILLSKYCNQEDILVGTPIAGRVHPDLNGILGVFVNTLVMRNQAGSGKTFLEFLEEVKKNAIDAYENQDYQFEELVDKLQVERDMSRNPIFDTLFQVQNMEKDKICVDGLEIKTFEINNHTAKFDMTMTAFESGEEILIGIEYKTALFRKETIERFGMHYLEIVKHIIQNPNSLIRHINMMTLYEKNQILNEFNNTEYKYENNKMLHEIFEEQVARIPDHKAVSFQFENMTYKELNERANYLAAVLRAKGVKRESVIGLMVERSFDMIIAVLAIWKAGGVYLPIDPNYPKNRIDYILNDSNVYFILTNSSNVDKILGNDKPTEIILLDHELTRGCRIDNLGIINQPCDLAYLIYTSGSTGQPKGVMIEHRSAVNRMHWMQKQYELNEEDVILQKTTFTFDVSVWELTWWFFAGATVHFLEPNYEMEPKNIANAISQNKVTTVHFVPSMLDVFLDYMKECGQHDKLMSLKKVFASGEELKCTQVIQFKKNMSNTRSELINLYGPTEAAIDVSYYNCSEIPNTPSIPIGKPIDNINLFIVDRNIELLPVGIPGELCIAGIGLARGYINNETLTKEKFIDNPFERGTKLYKTGDLARWLPDGNIEFLGRIDNQVKIRGFRIELGEIDNWLLKYEGIKEARVLLKYDSMRDPYLCAYFTANNQLSIEEVRKYLLKNLPKYMVPTSLLQIEFMPLKSNGKLDVKLLPEPGEYIQKHTELQQATSPLEKELVSIWNEVLGISNFGIQHNFFDLGGQSLKAIRLINKILTHLNVQITFAELSSAPTIKELAELIQNKKQVQYLSTIEKAGEQPWYPISSSQKRILYLYERNQKDTSYNMPIVLEIIKNLDDKRLEESFQQLIERHEVFRTSFHFIHGSPVQIVHPNSKFKLEYAETDAGELQARINEYNIPFDLQSGELLRVVYFKVNGSKDVLFINIHHIISDAVSIELFVQELIAIYKGISRPELTIQYKDYCVWQDKQFNSLKQLEFKDFWLKQLKDFVFTQLPKRSQFNDNEGISGNIFFEFDDVRNKQIDELCKKVGVTKFAYFTAILNIILMHEVNEQDITIGAPVFGRNHEQLQNLIGLFLNVVVIRQKINTELEFAQFLREVSTNLMDVLDHQDYQYDELVSDLKEDYGLKHDDLFSVMLNYMPYNHDANPKELGDFIQESEAYSSKISPKYDMTIYIREQEETVSVNIVYKQNDFDSELMQRIANHLLLITDCVTKNNNIPVGKIDYLVEDLEADDLDNYFDEDVFIQ